MLRYALGFFIVALTAAVFGFTGIALAAAGMAKLLFFIFVILFVLSVRSFLARAILKTLPIPARHPPNSVLGGCRR